MKILLTGVTGYIGKRLLTVLAERGYDVVCAVRDLNRFQSVESQPENISAVEVDFLDAGTLSRIPPDIDAAYYLIHSMSASADYDKLEQNSAENFRAIMERTGVKHVIYLSGIVNDKTLSKHVASRRAVEHSLAKGKYHLTTLRGGIIIGSGSASFEIIRDLVGHGVGRDVHEDPQVPNRGEPGEGALLREGMVLAIEPMLA
ncbi:MAG: NAD(P)H-binding protein, partial [Bacteroidales bacterium]